MVLLILNFFSSLIFFLILPHNFKSKKIIIISRQASFPVSNRVGLAMECSCDSYLDRGELDRVLIVSRRWKPNSSSRSSSCLRHRRRWSLGFKWISLALLLEETRVLSFLETLFLWSLACVFFFFFFFLLFL